MPVEARDTMSMTAAALSGMAVIALTGIGAVVLALWSAKKEKHRD